MRNLLLLPLVLLIATVAVGCHEERDAPKKAPKASTKQWTHEPPMTIDPSKRYTATLETTYGDIVIRLLPKEAPHAVNNFVFLAREGFYDNVTFHRIMKFMLVQTGDPTGTGTGGPGYTIKSDPVRRKYLPGSVVMAVADQRFPKRHTAGSQFYIVHEQEARLATYETVFGLVTEGMDVVDDIAYVPVSTTAQGEVSSPDETVRVTRVKIDVS